MHYHAIMWRYRFNETKLVLNASQFEQKKTVCLEIGLLPDYRTC
jgi:hypothetical protein